MSLSTDHGFHIGSMAGLLARSLLCEAMPRNQVSRGQPAYGHGSPELGLEGVAISLLPPVCFQLRNIVPAWQWVGSIARPARFTISCTVQPCAASAEPSGKNGKQMMSLVDPTVIMGKTWLHKQNVDADAWLSMSTL